MSRDSNFPKPTVIELSASQHLRVAGDCRPASGTRWPWYSPTDAFQLDWLSDEDVLEAAIGDQSSDRLCCRQI